MIDPPVRAVFRADRQNPELELSRHLENPIEEVWSALTTPARLAEWMGVEWLGGLGPLREGAAFDYRFKGAELESRGRVLRLEAPSVFEHSWFDNIPPSQIVRWTLAREGDGCRLTLTHRFGAPDDAPRTAAGWTQHLETLAAYLGQATPPGAEVMATWRRRRDDYAKAFGPAATRDARAARIDGLPALRFERRLARPPEAVWEVLTQPALIARWMQADAIVEPREGGRFRLGLNHGAHPMEGRITRWLPPSLLEYTWTEAAAGGDSLVRFELAARDGGCDLVLTHILKAGGRAAGFASGWHWHLDALDRARRRDSRPEHAAHREPAPGVRHDPRRLRMTRSATA